MSDRSVPADSMSVDYSLPLWLLKLGCLANLYFIANTPMPFTAGSDTRVVLPAQILFFVSAYRCLFPVRYEGNVVFHDSPLSSIFATRLLATFSEVAYIVLFAQVLLRINQDQLHWVTLLAWLMVAQVVVSQGLVWAAVLTGRLRHYFHEELGWAFIFGANTAASAGLLLAAGAPMDGLRLLLQLNLLFGALYLPWQCLHLRALRANAQRAQGDSAITPMIEGLHRALRVKNRRYDAASWGGWIGLSWMMAYWATLIPLWVFTVARTLLAP